MITKTMTNEKFVKEFYEPYNEAYRLIRLIKDCGPSDSDEIWAEYAKRQEEFSKKYDTEAGRVIAKMVMDIADLVAKENEKND